MTSPSDRPVSADERSWSVIQPLRPLSQGRTQLRALLREICSALVATITTEIEHVAAEQEAINEHIANTTGARP